MTNQIPADKVRPILDEWERIKEYADWEAMDSLVQDVRDLLPPPTLADMTEDDLAECQWMQADTEARGRAIIIVTEWVDGHAELIDRWGNSFYAAHDTITPRPDLPRMTWPGEQQPAPALPGGWRFAEHPDHGRVIVTNSTPDTDGHVYFVDPAAGPVGHACRFCTPDELTYIYTPEAAPPNTLTVGSEWDDAAALSRACDESHRDQIVTLDADGYAFVWSGDAEWWEGSVSPIAPPYTIIYPGREATDAVD